MSPTIEGKHKKKPLSNYPAASFFMLAFVSHEATPQYSNIINNPTSSLSRVT